MQSIGLTPQGWDDTGDGFADTKYTILVPHVWGRIHNGT